MSEGKKVEHLDDILPTVFTYELNQIEPEHSREVNEWLTKARQSGEVGKYFIHSFNNDTDEYMYTYVYEKGYSDYEVSFIYNPKDLQNKGSIHVTGLKNNSINDSFVKIKSINDLSIRFIMSNDTIEEKLKD